MLLIEVDHCHSVAVDLYSNDFVTRWASLFSDTAGSCSINQSESFACNLTETQAQIELAAAISAVNTFLRRDFINQPHTVDWNDQSWYNYLHERFEKLSGTYGHPTRLFSVAPKPVRNAIRAVNFLVHRLEIRPYAQQPFWYISFDKDCYTRLPLQDTDYQLFRYQLEPGQVYIHYAELGKTTWDIFKDGLTPDYSAMKNLHYYSAEISVYLGQQKIDLLTPEFTMWADQNQIDLNRTGLGLGFVPVGQVKDIDTVRQIVYNGSSISNIKIT